ncbi:hypothetical protein JXA12_00590 [Candidatus Woesearchaeota archaeon]|nr:hypothetical protein [Candidatus Woesearchaeota archaeon]
MKDEQAVSEDAVVVPELEEEDRERIKEEVREAAAEAEEAAGSGKTCIVCGKEAAYCMRGLPNNTYCKQCAKEHFKFLNYLERL